MSDHPFMTKMDMEGGFKESALRLNSFVVSTPWNTSKLSLSNISTTTITAGSS